MQSTHAADERMRDGGREAQRRQYRWSAGGGGGDERCEVYLYISYKFKSLIN